MAIIGFHFTKFNVEKSKAATGKIEVKNNIILNNLKEANVVGRSKQKGIEFKFSYTTTFNPEVGSILLEGALVYLTTEEKVKETLGQWEKEKKLPPEVIQEVYNNLLERCSIEALFLGRDMQLPPHVPLPKITNKEIPKETKEEKKKK